MNMLRWYFVGRGEYAHPALKWASWPLFRAVMLVFVVLLFLGETGHGWTPWKIAGVAFLGISLAADLANWLVLSSRRR
jgi:hypothetical protein